MDIDANGIVTSGKYQGYHINDVEKYLEDLEAATVASGTPKAEPKAPKPDPNKVLAEHAAERTGGLSAPLQQRLEQDDELAFANTVPDYPTYKPDIDKMKEALVPAARIQKGLHAYLYAHIKLQKDAKVKHAIYGTPLPAEEPKKEEEPETGETGGERKEEKEPVKADPLAQIKREPKAASPVAAPTGASREASKDQVRKPKLVANEKIRKMAEHLGKPVDEYLLTLEDSGTTQDVIDMAAVRRISRQSRIYGG